MGTKHGKPELRFSVSISILGFKKQESIVYGNISCSLLYDESIRITSKSAGIFPSRR
jgi:hypothetical protein